MEDFRKNHALLGSAYRLDGANGRVVNTAHERLATIIHDYDPTLKLCWIPTDKRGPQDLYPYALVHTPVGKAEYIVCNMTEEEVNRPELVLSAIFKNDMAKNGNLFSDLEAWESAKRILEAKEREDALEEKKEFAKSVLKSKLHAYKHGGKVYK